MSSTQPVTGDALLKDTFWTFHGRASKEQYRDHYYGAPGMGVGMFLFISLALIIIVTPLKPTMTV
ncbi:MAG: hypothetical protein V3V03_02950, partial [Hyphomonadaceae bacterium]